MKVNIGLTDRIARILLVAFIGGLIVNDKVMGIELIILSIIGIITYLTSAFGVSPIYSILGFNTIIKD